MNFKRIIIYMMFLLLFGLVACAGDEALENNNNEFGVMNNNGDGPFALGNGQSNDGNPFDTISSDRTNTPSSKYPHTKAVKIQEAKYKYVRVNQKQQDKRQARTQHQQTRKQHWGSGQNAKQRQEAKQQGPVDQQPTETKDQAQSPTQQQPQEQPKTPAKDQPQQGLSSQETRVVELTNEQRRKNGLADLHADTQLSGVARQKSTDMQTNNYFSHTSPTHGSPFDMMRDFGVSYQTAGENIAQGQQTPEEVVNAWMNSEGHRKNILSQNFTHIGVGYDQNGHHWTQMFIGK